MPIHKVARTVEIEEDDGFTCDRCGTRYVTLEQGCVIKHRFGYHSPRDGDEFEAVICEECLVALVSTWPTATLKPSRPTL